MESTHEPDFNVLVSRKCPHLGLLDDDKTWSATDQMQNYCHFEKHPQPVDWPYQCQYCFQDEYAACPVLNTPRKAKTAIWKPSFQMKLRLPLLVALAVSLLLGGGYGIMKGGFPPLFQSAIASPAETQSSILIVPAVSTPTSTRLQVLPPTPAPSFTPTQQVELSATMTATKTLPPLPSFTPSATVYHTPTVGPGLNTPFGTQRIYIVHRVTAGESLEMLAPLYETTEAVLRAVNNLAPGAVLWLDVDIIILPGVKDPTGVEPRKPVYVEWKTTVQDLSKKYKVSVEQLRSDNGLSSDDFFPGKRWLVIPVVP